MTNIEKEYAILNLYMDNSDLFQKCEHLIFEDIWSLKINKDKYRIIKHNHGKGIKSDVPLITNMLTKVGYSKKEIIQGLSDPDYRIERNLQEYVKDLFDEWSKRILLPQLQRSHSELSSEIGDVVASLEDLKNAINQIESIKNNLSIEKSITDIHDESFKQYMEAKESKDIITGYSVGLKDLDQLTDGLKQEVIVMGAPPGAGKSSFMVSIINKVAIEQGNPVLIHSLEMPSTQLMKNMWANNLKINSYNIRRGNGFDEDILNIKNYRNKLKENLVIDDTPSITWQYVETRVRKMRKSIPLDKVIVVLIDYLQLMRNTVEETKGISSEEQFGIRCNSLLELSKKYNLCMIELSQLSRDVGKREDKKPTMGDLKGSGAIEANATQVWLLYRPDYFEKDPMENGISLKGLCEINVAKNRYGETGRRYVVFKGKYSAFEDFKMDDLTNNNNEPF